MTYDPTIDGPIERPPVLAPQDGRAAVNIPTRATETPPWRIEVIYHDCRQNRSERMVEHQANRPDAVTASDVAHEFADRIRDTDGWGAYLITIRRGDRQTSSIAGGWCDHETSKGSVTPDR